MKRKRRVTEEKADAPPSFLNMRFEAAIFPGRRKKTADWADDLQVDRVPAAKGRISAFITVEDLVRLLGQGLEVRLYRAHAEGPLDPALIVSSESFDSWLGEQVKTLEANPGPSPFVEP